ncbi:repeat domain in Vibrio, Colwellia, Bradyrhizobium and Shewanella [Kordia sp. SMS9]|uniref:fibronectin type III domain-containing protein n=1 Tax=Kordia sp. SMS9 TaxID=2282170 RepID=UPI000E0DCD74|nr:FG-GAP-like repeat-containing protein [Kordia sp. SMS9]AXG68840.1 repeat domain in Vibrio, Colwellia, Bradyrhizobium and Shewanella [Kordia sp. SMS9]
MKKITLLCMLMLCCTFAYAQILNQPANWPNTNWSVTGTYNAGVDAFEADPTLTANFAYDDDDAGNTTNNDIAAESPIVDITNAFTAGETWLTVDLAYNYNDNGNDILNIEYWDADAAAWVVWQQFTATTNQPNDNFCTPAKDVFTSNPLNISGFTVTQQSGFRYRLAYDDVDGWQWGFCFDSPTITSTTPPSCIEISNLAVANVTETAADISWNANSGETAWEIVIQPQGTGIPTGSGTAVTANAPYNATGLTGNTAYEVYVRANCGLIDGFSNWVGPIGFTTDSAQPPLPVGVTCATGTSSFLFTEDFENDPPSGWTGTGFDGSNGNWDITPGGANSGGTGPSVSFNGGNHLEYEASGNSTTIASAISPVIDLTSATDGAELSFYMHAFGDDIGTLNVGISTAAAGPFTNVYSWNGPLQTADTDAWVPTGIDISAYLGQTIYVEFSYGGTGTGFEGDMSIDLVRVEACGSFCIAPSGVTASNVTGTSADIGWTANSGETAWEYVVQPAGTGTPSSAGTSATTTSINVSSLAPSTSYEVYVRAICGSDTSTWSIPLNFSTTATPPPTPVGVTCASGSSVFIFTEDFENNPPSGWTGTGFDGSEGNWDIAPGNSNSNGTGPFASFSGGNHLEYEASGNSTAIASAISPAIDMTSATDGAELSFYMHAFGADTGTLNVSIGTAAAGPFTNVYSWTGELQTAGTDAWTPIGIDLSAYLGQIIYIEFSYGATGTGFEGDLSIDLVRVETCGSFCIAPSSIIASAITQDAATISWSPNSGETAWEYVVQPAGTGAPSGAGTSIATTSVNISSLTPSTSYEVYVRAICGLDTSIWGGPLTFTTAVPPPPATFTTSTVSTSGSQRAAVDMNGDFLDDVVSISSTNINIFYQQASGGLSTTPTNITTTAADFTPSWSLAAADYDRNGFTDLLYGGGSGVTFMRANATGTAFTEISGSEYVFSQRSNFVDLNNDGNLDAFVCHDVDPNVYYTNDGNGNLTFNQGGLGDIAGGGNYGSIWIDYDNDRDMDMFIAKCRGGSSAININEMHENDGSGNFMEVASALNLADPIQTWSSAWGDFDNDGDMDVFVGASSTSNGTHKLMRNNGNSTFTDVTAASGILPALTNIGIENATHDFDNDGNLDIASNGSILFGNGDLTFTVYDNILSGSNGSFGDLNNDGFMDAISGTTLYTNTANSNNWVKITTTGVASNINGIGARIEVVTAAGTQIRDVRSGEGFRFMSSLNTHFGLGTETNITNIIIYWPSGTVDNLVNPTINTHHIITEGQTLSIPDETLEKVAIHPNPVGNIMNINSPVNLVGKIATIFNIEGKRVMNLKLKQHAIDVSRLTTGNYILRLESDGKVFTQKFIKQ